MYLLQQLINGISQGSIYALMAIGYTLIVGVVGLVTFAYGEMVMIGAMSAYLFYTYVCPNFFLGILVSFICAGIAGIFIHKVAYERFLDAPKNIALLFKKSSTRTRSAFVVASMIESGNQVAITHGNGPHLYF